MSIENLLLSRPLSAGAQIDRLTCALASSTGHAGEDGLDVLIADVLRRVTQLLDADYAMVESEGTDGDRGRRHVWSRPGVIVGREPRVSVGITPKGGPPSEFSIGVRGQGVDLPPAVRDALSGLAHVIVLLLDRDEGRGAPLDDAPHAGLVPVWQPPDTCSADDFENIIGDSAALRRAIYRVQQVAPTDASVMLLGETGTGKELFARAIHNRSVRSGKPFVRVNCAALPSTLIETELFGHVRGAFTGAVAMRQGRFEIADGGTLFLDEIGDLPADVQAKLLRVLQEGEFERVGSSQSRRVDVRIVAATHHDLEASMNQGRFRADLYYRLNVFPIVLPPLRQRTEDIPRLVWYFVNRRQRALNRKFTTIPVSVYAALQERPWPGNVRELQNVIERAMIHSTGNMLSLDETPSSLPPVTARGTATLEDVERQYVQDALQRCRWRINGRGNAAETLGLHPNTLRNRMKKFGIQRPQAATPGLTA
jgi:formate hydrogenlyase transcriptional activator